MDNTKNATIAPDLNQETASRSLFDRIARLFRAAPAPQAALPPPPPVEPDPSIRTVLRNSEEGRLLKAIENYAMLAVSEDRRIVHQRMAKASETLAKMVFDYEDRPTFSGGLPKFKPIGDAG